MSKARLEELERLLRQRRETHEMMMMRELMRLYLEDVKNRFIRCKADDFMRLQGRAEVLTYVLERLETSSLEDIQKAGVN